VAVLVNRAALAASLGDKAGPDAIDKQVKEIEQLVTSAAGLRKDRGDAVKISVVDFVDSGKDLEPVPAPSFLEIVERQTGTLISAGVILLIAVLLILFGIRPVTRALLAPPPAALEALESPPERRWPSGSYEALARFTLERSRGAKLIDIGCMQINQHWHGAHFRSVAEMFDPEQNVQYAASYLKSLYQDAGSWTVAVARYNAGPGNPQAQRTYVCAVIAHMVASGEGRWTLTRAFFASGTAKPDSSGSSVAERRGSAQDVDHVFDERSRGRRRPSGAREQTESDVRQTGDLRGRDESRALGRQPLGDGGNAEPGIDGGLQHVEIRALAYDFEFPSGAMQRGGGDLVVERTLRGGDQLHGTVLRRLVAGRRNPTHRQPPFRHRVFRAAVGHQGESDVELIGAKAIQQRLRHFAGEIEMQSLSVATGQTGEVRHQKRRELARHSQTDRIAARALTHHEVEHFVVLGENLSTVIEAYLAAPRQNQPRSFLEQGRFDQFLQPFHLEADRRLRASQILRRPRETARVHHRDKGSEHVDGDGAHGGWDFQCMVGGAVLKQLYRELNVMTQRGTQRR
jgi:hypothetical protein